MIFSQPYTWSRVDSDAASDVIASLCAGNAPATSYWLCGVLDKTRRVRRARGAVSFFCFNTSRATPSKPMLCYHPIVLFWNRFFILPLVSSSSNQYSVTAVRMDDAQQGIFNCLTGGACASSVEKITPPVFLTCPPKILLQN